MITDAIGNATSLFYDDEGLLSELVDSAGQRLMCRYAQGRLREVARKPPKANGRWRATATMSRAS